MPITFVGATIATNSGGNTTIAVPSGVQPGDVLLIVAESYAGYQITPSGWTSFSGSATASLAAWHPAANADPTSVSWLSTADPYSSAAVMLAYRGCDAAAPINQSSYQTRNLTSAPSTSGITPTVGSCRIVGLFAATIRSAGASTAGPGATLRAEGTGPSYGGEYSHAVTEDLTQTTPASVTLSLTAAASGNWGTWIVALAPGTAPPAAGAPGWLGLALGLGFPQIGAD